MRISSLFALLAGLAAMLVVACQPTEKPSTVKITLQLPAGFSAPIAVNTMDVLSFAPILLAEATPDSTGKAVLEFTLAEACFASLNGGELNRALYLSPGDDLRLRISTEEDYLATTYSGTGAAVNGYLARASYIHKQHERFKGPQEHYIFNLPAQAFIARADSLEKALHHFHTYYTDSLDMPADLTQLLQERNQIDLLGLRLNYALTQSSDPSLPEAFKELLKEVPLDAAHLKQGMQEYALLLHLYLDAQVYAPHYQGKSFPEIDSLKDQILLAVDEDITSGAYPAAIKEYFRAKNIFHTLDMKGLSPGIQTLLRDFKEKHPASPYLATLEKKHQAWLLIEPGAPAPDISGQTPEGEPLSLSQLKGKVVYADVWATWCGPCRAEFPYSKELKKTFANTEEVVFLYVSVDENRDAWKNMLAEDPDFTGTHIHAPDGWEASFMENYQIRGIPRYILIDQQGTIVQASASRPSSGKVEQEIRALLANKHLAMH